MAKKRDISQLQHTRITFPRGGKVVVLDTGAVIGAEAEAMLQALHSRSVGGLEHHLTVLASEGPERFMEKFYIGYGHSSIGDCGTATLFIEGVSMLAAKAYQDNPLYSGQEASTRYVDFSKQAFMDPTGTTRGRALQELQRAFYITAQEPTKEYLRIQHPLKEGENKELYEKAIVARAFDVTRSLLPAGATTNLAWHTNLRQAADKLLFLRHHPLQELREEALATELALLKHFPNSFGQERVPSTEQYQDLLATHYYYFDQVCPTEPRVDLRGIDREELKRFEELFQKRPPKIGLPFWLGQTGQLTAEFQLDFGSYRDIQRHRAINQRMPLLTTKLGFNSWYRENLPEEIRDKLDNHLEAVQKGVQDFGVSELEAQYFIPMGYNVANKFTGTLPGAVYMVELRDSRFVHPTLQRVAHSIAEQIRDGLGILLHTDGEPNRFDIQRGAQDIVRKNES